MEFIKLVNDNPIFIFIISITGLVGFLITIYLSFKTKSISRTLRNISIAKDFNKERNLSIARLEGFSTNLSEDIESVSLSTIRFELHREVKVLYSRYRLLLSLREKCTFIIFIKTLSRKNLNPEKTILHINNTIAILSNKKEGL